MIRDMTTEEREKNVMKKIKQNSLKKIVPEGDKSLTNGKQVMYHGIELQNTLKRPLTDVSDDEMMRLGLSYIEFCDETSQAPTEVGLSLWLGVTHETFKRWKNSPHFKHFKTISLFVDFFQHFAEQKAMDGMLSPLVYFFQAKNYWGMSDQTEIVHKTQNTQVIDITEQQRILNSTPGVVVDAAYTVVNDEPEEVKTIPLQHEDLDKILSGDFDGDFAADQGEEWDEDL